nr:hypothetical protein [Catenulispora pinisilvae]
MLQQALFDDGLDELRAVEVARKRCHADPGDSSDLRQRHLATTLGEHHSRSADDPSTAFDRISS